MSQESNQTSANRGQYDTVSKNIIQQNPEDWIRFGLGIPAVEFIQILETEQPTVKSNRADSFIHAKVDGLEAVIHFEFQTRDSIETPMPQRIAGYVGRCIETYKLPVYSHVIYLHPDAGRNDKGMYIQEKLGYVIHIQYKVIRLGELNGQDILDEQLKGLIPFTPLMKGPEGIGPDEWLRKCVQIAKRVNDEETHQVDYLSTLGILSGIIFDYQTISDIILEETMQESSVIQHFTQQGIKQGIEQGIEQGIREGTIEAIIEVLLVHFEADEVNTLKPMLERIEEIQYLKKLLQLAASTESLTKFKENLEEQ